MTQYRNGLGHTPSYQSSGRPFLSSSLDIPELGQTPVEIKFQTVSKFVVITNTVPVTDLNAPLRFGFSANGVNAVEFNNYVVLNNGESFEGELKVTSVFLISDSAAAGTTGSVVAGLTGIERKHLGANWSGSSGVG